MHFFAKQTLTGNKRAPISPTKQPESHYGGPMASKSDNVNFDEFAKILGGHGEAVREAKDIQPALQRAREAVKSGIPAIVNIWVDKEEFAPGTKNQTMYK